MSPRVKSTRRRNCCRNETITSDFGCHFRAIGYIGTVIIQGDNQDMAKQSFKLDKMEFADLVQLRDDVQSALSGKIEMERRELQGKLAEIERIQSGAKPAVRRGRPVGGNGWKHPAKGKKVAPKYRGPNGETWAGRGLTPTWLVELEAKGKKRESFLIKQ
jgi:DNA-binding protein H-NS